MHTQANKPTIYVTRKLPDLIANRLEAACHVKMWEEADIPVPRDVLLREVRDADGLLCLLTERIDAELLQQAHRLKIVSNMAVGYNNIDVAAATAAGVMVANTPGVLTETTADLTFALLMATARRLVEASDLLRGGGWKTWSPMLLTGQDVYGATLGIIGMGAIGEAVARRARAFDMNVVYYNRSRRPEAEERYGLTYTDMDSLLSQSDYVCVMAPYTPETINLIDEPQLALMKPTAILINSARGGIVNEDALYRALKDGRIWAAGLDVFDVEPVPTDHPLLTLPNVVALPHIGSASIQTRMKMAHLSVDNLLLGLAGERPTFLVNPEALG